MNRLYFVYALVVFAMLNGLADAKFPNDPKPCNHEDSECMIKIINHLMQEKLEGDSSLNFVKIDPLSVSKISLKQGEESPVNIDLTFNDNIIYGLRHANAYKVTGFGKDLQQKHEIHLKLKSVSLVGPYTINGKILILPISGSGKSNITMINPDLTLTFMGTPMEKDGTKYMTIKNMKLDVNPEGMHYEFGNLFNGDKALGDNMNLFLNENWRDIFVEVKASMTAAFAQIFQSIINNIFQKYPYDKFFAQ